jgi:hypothetical protein
MDIESPSVELKTRAVDQRVQNLIQQARLGDVEAYNSLALCYRDGDGVEQSWLNMICMYAIYCQKTGGDIEGVIELLEEGNPFRLIYEIVETPCSNEEIKAKMDQLRLSAPAEAKAVEAAKKVFSIEEAKSALSIIREAESEGSELAAILQVIYYDETKDKTGQEECLIRIAEKYPFFNLMLGESYVLKYHECEDYSYIQKAIECYYKADAYGMLNPKYASALLRMYDNFGEKGLLKSDEKEIERLKILAKRTY